MLFLRFCRGEGRYEHVMSEGADATTMSMLDPMMCSVSIVMSSLRYFRSADSSAR